MSTVAPAVTIPELSVEVHVPGHFTPRIVLLYRVITCKVSLLQGFSNADAKPLLLERVMSLSLFPVCIEIITCHAGQDFINTAGFAQRSSV